MIQWSDVKNLITCTQKVVSFQWCSRINWFQKVGSVQKTLQHWKSSNSYLAKKRKTLIPKSARKYSFALQLRLQVLVLQKIDYFASKIRCVISYFKNSCCFSNCYTFILPLRSQVLVFRKFDILHEKFLLFFLFKIS